MNLLEHNRRLGSAIQEWLYEVGGKKFWIVEWMDGEFYLYPDGQHGWLAGYGLLEAQVTMLERAAP